MRHLVGSSLSQAGVCSGLISWGSYRRASFSHILLVPQEQIHPPLLNPVGLMHEPHPQV